MEMTRKEKKAWEEWLETSRRIKQGFEPIKDESEDKKRKRIEMLLKPQNFDKFIKYYFETPENPFADLGWFHWKAIDNLFIKKEENNIWEWHRESAKSVFADIFVGCHMLFTGALTGCILASENEDKAKNLIKDIQAQLMNNRRIISDFGDFGITGSWMQGYFQTKDGIGFWAFGLGQNPAGVRNGFNRPNLGIVDDADNKDKAKNQKLTKERVDWINGEFKGCLRTNGSYFIYVNNRVHKHGLTAHMVGDLEEGDPINEGIAHIKVFFTEDPVTHERLMPEEGGVPAWKENFTIERVKKKIKSMGYRNAMRQLYHWHIEDGNIFTDDIMPWVDIMPLSKYDSLVTYCDPAFGDSGKGCYRAIIFAGLKNKNYDIIWVWIRQNGNFARAHREIAEQIESNRLTIAANEKAGLRVKINCAHWVESNELQKKLLKNIYKEENDLNETAWYPKYDMDKKADKIGRIESLETIAENKHIRFNAALKKDKDMQTLRDQFKGFPDGFVDGPDAVEGAIKKLGQKAKASKSTTRAGKYKRTTARMG